MKKLIALISQFAISNIASAALSITLVLAFAPITPGCRRDTPPTPTSISSGDRPFVFRTPFWSKDGTRILGLSHTFGIDGDDLYEVSADGGGVRTIFHDTLEKDLPILSPAGSSIEYLAAQVGRIYSRAHVWVINSDGGNARDLTPSGGNWENVRWSPDSRYLVFDGLVEDSGSVNYQIVRANVESGESRLLTRSARFGNRDASFLTTGDRIAYTSSQLKSEYGGKVCFSGLLTDSSRSAAGPKSVPIDTTPTSSISPRPLPVGNMIYFLWGTGGEAGAGVYGLDLDAVKLPAAPSSFVYLYRGDYFNFAQWSPDGSMLLYLKGNPSSDLYLLDRRSRTERRITTGFAVRLFSYAWSSDSKRLVFSASEGAGPTANTFIYDIEANVLNKLTITHM